MSSMDKVAKELYSAMTKKEERAPKPYDTEAEVVREEGDTIWVKIPGGIDETPVRKTINAKAGDNIQVRVADGRAWVTGNSTNPPTDDTTANYAVNISNRAQKNVTVLNNIVTDNIEATNARFGYVEADTAKIHNLEADEIHAGITYTNELIAEDVTTEKLTAASGYISDLTADHITAGDIVADHADIDDLKANKADINLANVNVAWIEQGNIKKAEVFDENVFDLSGNRATLSRIDASKINVANLRADNLVVRRINGQPVVGGYTLIDSNSPQYETKNPQALGWYEFVNAQWVLSTDTTVDMTKAYYQEGNEVSLYDQAYIDALESDLQQQIDGAVETFTGSVVPTLVNYPYTDWYDTSVTPVHDERAKHVGDIYYVVNSSSPQGGYCYRFTFDNTTHAYSWVLIKDSDVTKALSDISELQTFESETTSWIEETDEGLETIRTNHTALSGVVDKTVKESVQLWFTKANTTAPAKPTTEVTSTSTAGNAWRKVVPAWNASYPNYYYCWQYKFVDGTFGWSDVVRDIAMGETQGTARDAKNTADAALPASTFTSFESTTFKNVKDTVDEQSTKFTNMTTRLGLNSDGTEASTDIVNRESALEQTVEGISSTVSKTEMKLAGMYALSQTSAGTAAKAATITPALSDASKWELTAGTMVTVKFTNANTAANPTLNINSKGAKAIKTYAGGNLSADEYKWKAGSTFTFTYNGTNWLMQDSTASVRINTNETQINQTADSIISLASGNTTYTKPDGTTATSTIGTTVNQTANNVLIKATRDGATAADKTAGGTSAIGLINVSPDNVVIAAKHVDIAGAAVFNNYSTTLQMNEAINGAVDSIEVGGNNLLLNSEHFNENTTPYKNSNVTRYSATYGNEPYVYCSGSKYIQIDFPELTVGEAYILSFEAIRQNTQPVFVTCGEETTNVGTTNDTTIWKRFVYKFTASTSTTNAKVRVNNASSDGRDDFILAFRQFQLEKGNAATAWNPSPSETKSTHTLTALNTSGTTYANLLNHAREGNVTDWNVTSTSGVRIGDTVRVAYKATDMGTDGTIVYVLGTVTAINSDINLVMTSHGLDTTVIDGGHILTGTIDANKVNINTLNVSSSSGWSGMLNNNIQIGGRNLATGTAEAITMTTKAGQSWFNPISYPISDYGGNVIADTSNVQCTISCDYSISGVDTICSLGVSVKSSSNIWDNGITIAVNIPVGSSSGHAKGTFNINDGARQYAGGQGILFYRTGDSSVNTGISLTISNLKVEIGNKATDWTPAPEDTKEIHTLNSAHLSTGENYSTILGWCEDGNEHGFDIDYVATPLTNVKVGDIVRIKYFAKNVGINGAMIYLVGTVREFYGTNNATIKLASMNIESTVVDGGHILTGTIDTNRLNANTIKSQIVQTTDLSADRIKSGTISTSRLPADALKTIRTVERNSGAPYATIKDFAALDPCAWTTIIDTTGVRVGDTCRVAIPVTDMSGVTAYITGTVTAVPSKTALTMTNQSISSTTIDGGMILTGKVAASHIETGDITIGQSQVTNLSTDLNNIRAQYGYTDTAAGTATKVVVLPNYVDRQGAIIAVRFANGNTVSPISLNVNNTGVKTVQTVDPINDLPAATTCHFIRDEFGQWRYLGSDASSWVSKEYASALSSAKQISTYTRSFTKAQWDTYGAHDHSESWSAYSSQGYDNTHISVGDKAYLTGHVSDKAGWYAAILGTVTSVSTTSVIMTSIKVLYNSAQTEKYVTKIDESGILISPSGNNALASAPQNSIKIDGNGLNVYKGGVSVASYGDYARVGKENAQRLETKSDGVYIYDGSNVQRGYFGSFARIGNYNGPNVRMDSTGVNINTSADNSVAFYGDSARIGKDASPHIAITSSEIQMWKGASSTATNKLFSITTTHNMPALASDTDIWLESGSSGGDFSTIHVSGSEAGMQAEDASHDSALYVIANGTSLVNFDTRYLQLSGQASDSTLWFIDDTIPPQGSKAFDAVWHKSANDNYGLYRPSSSSRRYKEDIMPVQSDRLDPHRLYDIEVVQFKFKEGTFLQDDPYEENRVDVIGFIAEDVYEHYPQAAIMLDDEVENWDERYIIPPMLKLIQEQNDRITELERRLS